jgi:hypothetical protein
MREHGPGCIRSALQSESCAAPTTLRLPVTRPEQLDFERLNHPLGDRIPGRAPHRREGVLDTPARAQLLGVRARVLWARGPSADPTPRARPPAVRTPATERAPPVPTQLASDVYYCVLRTDRGSTIVSARMATGTVESVARLRGCIFAIAVYILLGLCSCSNTITPPQASNLVQNPSFEVGGAPSLEGWTSFFATLVDSAPVGGGQWALQLENASDPGFASTVVSGLVGRSILRLSAHIRAQLDGTVAYLSLRVLRSRDVVHVKTVVSSAMDWNVISLTDTLALEARDSVNVFLSINGTAIDIRHSALFDEIELKKYQ